MKRLTITILSITLMALAGCGDDDSNGGGGHFIVNYFDAVYGQAHASLRVDCECNFADVGYADAEECYEDNAIPESQLNEALSCFEDAANAYDTSPPQSVDDYFGCLTDGFADGETCIEDASDADGEICTEDADAARDACESDMDDELDACEDGILDEEGQAWMDDSDDELNESMEECFDILEGSE